MAGTGKAQARQKLDTGRRCGRPHVEGEDRLRRPNRLIHLFLFLHLMFPSKTRCADRGPSRCARWSGVQTAVLALCVHVNAVSAQSQPHVIEGHVLHASLQSKLPGVLVVAWPCGLATATDASGAFRVACPHGIDSLSVSCVGFETQSVLASADHLDVWLNPLNVDLDQAMVATVRTLEMEAASLSRAPLLEALDATPGLQSLDLGAGMIQPVIRGLFGARVVVLEDGVPQQGGRWGADHGVLVAPELQVVQSWTPGGGHVWMGPDAMGGGLRYESPSLVNTSGIQTAFGVLGRVGNAQGRVHALHTSTRGDRHWHAGLSLARFGATQVPQRTFSYIGRTYELETGELPNTGGQSAHAVLGFGRRVPNGGVASWSMRASDIQQGLFPGIVGVPVQGDLEPNDHPFEVRIPLQHASRLASSFQWEGPTGASGRQWTGKLAGAFNRRLEFAPPHAHGWGPEPDSDLSLSFEEHSAFIEGRRIGPHAKWGVQAEGQWVQTAGWEFLVPSHRRLRGSLMVEGTLRKAMLSARLDGVIAQQDGYEEPQYNAEGAAIGEDVRALPFEQFVPGGMVSWLRTIAYGNQPVTGSIAVAVHGRVPSNQEWGANGIHHGTFRFEQGDPDLATEWTAESRASIRRTLQDEGWNWKVDAFVAIHDGFISLTPSGSFAPISHAGQVYAFQANDAFRTGLEATTSYRRGRHCWSGAGSALGQWDIRTGLGLPFTTPTQVRLAWEGSAQGGLRLELAARAVAPSWLTARNEAHTPGAVLSDLTLCQTTEQGQWSLKVHNAFNTPWLDHISAYRALGLVAQGRWVQLSFSTTLEPSPNKKKNT